MEENNNNDLKRKKKNVKKKDNKKRNIEEKEVIDNNNKFFFYCSENETGKWQITFKNNNIIHIPYCKNLCKEGEEEEGEEGEDKKGELCKYPEEWNLPCIKCHKNFNSIPIFEIIKYEKKIFHLLMHVAYCSINCYMNFLLSKPKKNLSLQSEIFTLFILKYTNITLNDLQKIKLIPNEHINTYNPYSPFTSEFIQKNKIYINTLNSNLPFYQVKNWLEIKNLEENKNILFDSNKMLIDDDEEIKNIKEKEINKKLDELKQKNECQLNFEIRSKEIMENKKLKIKENLHMDSKDNNLINIHQEQNIFDLDFLE